MDRTGIEERLAAICMMYVGEGMKWPSIFLTFSFTSMLMSNVNTVLASFF